MGEKRQFPPEALFLRALGAVSAVAFACLLYHLPALLESDGVLPIKDYLSEWKPEFLSLPSLFLFSSSDQALEISAWTGLVLSVFLTFGIGNALTVFCTWAIYLSFVNTGQIFYGYGWESLLLETLFLAMFLLPVFCLRAAPYRSPIIMLLLRWVLFRLMFGAGLIKLRGDECWRDLTCLYYHYETQPVPNPLSWYFAHLPPTALRTGLLFNHVVELLVPWLFFAPAKFRRAAGFLTIVFQVLLILSGNLSWLNYLTIVLCISCFDRSTISFPASVSRRWVEGVLVLFIGVLSIAPSLNLFSPHQAMNASFEPFHLVNTYGAFGSVGKERYEVILEGTTDETVTADTKWQEYELPCKPGDPERRPCVISPFHLRLDWQIWFAAMSSLRYNPWLLAVVGKLLDGNKSVGALFAKNPFPVRPPHFIRGELYRYRFTDWGEKAWWRRERVDVYFPPIAKRRTLK